MHSFKSFVWYYRIDRCGSKRLIEVKKIYQANDRCNSGIDNPCGVPVFRRIHELFIIKTNIAMHHAYSDVRAGCILKTDHLLMIGVI